MQFLEEEILEIAETPMAVNVGLRYSSLRPTGFNGSGRRVFHRESKNIRSMDGRGVVVRVVEIAPRHRGWTFSHEPGGGSEQDFSVAMYELTNIIADNIKSLLPEPCQLSLLTVEATMAERLRILGMEWKSELAFDCQDQPLFVSVWQRQFKT